MGFPFQILAAAIVLVGASAGCAFETHSVGPGNGGLDGSGVEDTNQPETTVPETTSTDTSTTNTVSILEPENPTDAIAVEPVCTPGTERSSCSGTSCDPTTLVCTTMMLASRGTCETCFSDTNCASSDHRCVWMNYQGEPFPDERTGFCLKVTEPVTIDDDGGYVCEPPFTVTLVARQSPSGGKDQTYCGIHEKITTCMAVLAFHQRKLCPSGRDDECPPGGLCRAIATSGKKTEFACTYACTEDAECSSSTGRVSCAGYCGG